MNDECVKLTTYLGERHRANGAFLADALLDCYQRHGFRTSILLRGALGFGIGHHLRSDRLLTLSEDLPVISVAVDTRARIEAALPEVRKLTTKGLVTLERARLLGERPSAGIADRSTNDTKLTIYVGRKQRIAGKPAHVGVVETLHRLGVAGATVLLGVDGTLHGARQRAAFFGRNADVPMMIISIGTGATTAAAFEELETRIEHPLATIERVHILKRDGERMAGVPPVADTDSSGLHVWQKLMIYTGEQSRDDDGRPIYQQLVRSLREAGAAGATCIRGIWGYHGAHQPHGDRFFSVRRHVPVVTVLVDSPERIRELYPIVDRLTHQTGLVTSEVVPAFRATGTGIRRGGLRLSHPV